MDTKRGSGHVCTGGPKSMEPFVFCAPLENPWRRHWSLASLCLGQLQFNPQLTGEGLIFAPSPLAFFLNISRSCERTISDFPVPPRYQFDASW